MGSGKSRTAARVGATAVAVALAIGFVTGPSAADPSVGGGARLVSHTDDGARAHAADSAGDADPSADGAGGPVDAEPQQSEAPPADVPPTESAPTDPGDAVDRIIDLSHRAEQANQAVLAGQQAVDKAQEAQREADARERDAREALDAAQARVERYRRVADRVAAANYQGARINRLYALVLSDSPQQLIDQMSVLDEVTYRTQRKLSAFRSAVADAQAARSDAAQAADAAAAATRKAQQAQSDLVARRETLQERINRVRDLYGEMTGAARSRLVGELIPDGFDIDGIEGAGPEFAALQVALTRIGDPYVWGAAGPDSFDCSGLVQWAFAQVGESLPRTSQQQARGGTPVAPEDMRPGDVVTFYNDASHVGIYAGDGMMVHASTFGVPVKIQSVHAFPIHDVRRY